MTEHPRVKADPKNPRAPAVLPEVCVRPRPRGSSSNPRLGRRDHRDTLRVSTTLAPRHRKAAKAPTATVTEARRAMGTARSKARAACPRIRWRMRPSARFPSRTLFAAARPRVSHPRATNTNLRQSRDSDHQPMCHYPFVPSRHRRMRRQSLLGRGASWILYLPRRIARRHCLVVSCTQSRILHERVLIACASRLASPTVSLRRT